MSKNKKLRITEHDYLLANRKASREEEIAAHGKPVSFRPHLHRSRKDYNRATMKKAITLEDDGFFIIRSRYKRYGCLQSF